jgi:hypothetical protein
MDHILTVIGTIAAVVIGWALTWVSQANNSSKEHKQAIAHALSILLEVRYQLIYLNHSISCLRKKGFSEKLLPEIREDLFAMIGIGENEKIQKYEKAIEIVAKNAPLVAYEYQSRASLPEFLKKFRKNALVNGVSPQMIEVMESRLTSMVVPRMNELVLALARLHSPKTAKEVKGIIDHKFEEPEGFDDYFASVLEEAKLHRLELEKQKPAKGAETEKPQDQPKTTDRKTSYAHL